MGSGTFGVGFSEKFAQESWKNKLSFKIPSFENFERN